MRVINNDGDTDTKSIKVIVNEPRAAINYTKSNLQVNFDSTDPQDPSATGLAYAWNFGDGQTVSTTSKTFPHTYLITGTYNVSLTVTDAYGASNSVNASVIVAGEIAIINTMFCNTGDYSDLAFNLEGFEVFTLDRVIYGGGGCECKVIPLKIESHLLTVTSTDALYADGYYIMGPDGLWYWNTTKTLHPVLPLGPLPFPSTFPNTSSSVVLSFAAASESGQIICKIYVGTLLINNSRPALIWSAVLFSLVLWYSL